MVNLEIKEHGMVVNEVTEVKRINKNKINKKIVALLCVLALAINALSGYMIVQAFTPPVGSIPAVINGTGVNFRSDPSTSNTPIRTFSNGEQIYILDKSKAPWYQVEDINSVIGYCHSDYIKETGPAVTSPNPSSTGSNPTPTPTGISIHKNKTLYTRVDNAVNWESSNGAFATVDNGYILGKSPGDVVITAKDASGNVLSCKQYTVCEAEGVRTAYCSPNIAGFGDTVNLYAITDETRNAVRFVTNGKTIDSTTFTQDGSTRVFTATTSYGSMGERLGVYCLNTAEGYISNIAANTTVSAFLSGIPNSGNYKVYSGESEVPASSLVATGMTLKSSGGNSWTSLSIIVTGDTNGDGVITLSDLSRIRSQLLRISNLTGAFKIAADTNGDKDVTLSDLSQIRSQLLNIRQIAPLSYENPNTAQPSEPQTYDVKAYSSADGGANWSGDYKSSSAYIVSTSNTNTTTLELRRASDQIISMIATWEGFSSNVYPDQLAGGIPTLGYGYTFGVGSEFYNGITQREGYALLVNTVNNGTYTSSINDFLRNHNLRANQHQFDALVSMAYNLGPGYLNSTNDPQSWLVNVPGGDLNNMGQVYNGTADPNHKITQNIGKIGFANEMLYWTASTDKDNNKIHLGGLLRRRMVEALIFNEGIYQDMTFRDVFTVAPQYGYTVPIYDSSSSTYGYK